MTRDAAHAIGHLVDIETINIGVILRSAALEDPLKIDPEGSVQEALVSLCTILQMMENTEEAVVTTDDTKVVTKRIKVAAETSKTIWLVIPISKRKTLTRLIPPNQMLKAKRVISSGMASNGCQDRDRRLTSIQCRST